MRDFAGIFPDLQNARHRADYDPNARFSPIDVGSRLDAAVFAIEAFDRTTDLERTGVIALMLAKPWP